MKPPSDSARLLLEAYKDSITLGADQKARLGSVVQERVLRGDLPRFEVAPAAHAAPEPSFMQRVWSSTWGKLGVGVLAIGGVAAAGQYVMEGEAKAPSGLVAPVTHVTPGPATSHATPPKPAPMHEPAAVEPKIAKPVTPPALVPQVEKAEKAAASPSATAGEPTVDEEVKLVNAAQAALRAGDTRRSFELLGQHATRFPNGKLVTLRQVTHMMTLCQAGRGAEARKEAADFLASRPSSPFAERVKTICATP
jgi:hypothetical protein